MKKKLNLDQLEVTSFVTDAKGGQAPIINTMFCWNTERRSCQEFCELTLYPIVCY